MSKPATNSGFSDDASTIDSKHIAGRKFANSSSSFLIRNNPCSGLSEKSKSSHFSPPTAPSNTA